MASCRVRLSTTLSETDISWAFLCSIKSITDSFSIFVVGFSASIAIIISCFDNPVFSAIFSTDIPLLSVFSNCSLTTAIFLASSLILRLICTMPSSLINLCISPIIIGTAYVENAYPRSGSKRAAAFVSPSAPT